MAAHRQRHKAPRFCASPGLFGNRNANKMRYLPPDAVPAASTGCPGSQAVETWQSLSGNEEDKLEIAGCSPMAPEQPHVGDDARLSRAAREPLEAVRSHRQHDQRKLRSHIRCARGMSPCQTNIASVRPERKDVPPNTTDQDRDTTDELQHNGLNYDATEHAEDDDAFFGSLDLDALEEAAMTQIEKRRVAPGQAGLAAAPTAFERRAVDSRTISHPVLATMLTTRRDQEQLHSRCPGQVTLSYAVDPGGLCGATVGSGQPRPLSLCGQSSLAASRASRDASGHESHRQQWACEPSFRLQL